MAAEKKSKDREKNFSFAVFKEAAQTFRPAFKGQARGIAMSVVLTGVVIGFDLLKPWPMKYIFDEVLATGAETSTPFGLSLIQLAGLATAAYVLIALITSGLSARSSVTVAEVEKEVSIRIRRQVFDHLHRLEFPFHQTVKSGDLLQRVMSDVSGVRRLIYSSWVSLAERVIVVGTTATVMFFLDPWFAALALLPLPLHGIIVSRYSAKVKAISREQRRRESAATSVATESLRQIRLVKAFAAEDRVARIFAEHADSSEEHGAEATRAGARMSLMTDLVNAVGIGTVLLVGAIRAIAGALTAGELLVLVTYARSLYRPIGKMSTDGGRLATAAVNAERLLEVLKIRPEEPGAGELAPRFAGTITFDDVHYAHPGGLRALKGVSFTIPAGSLALMIGPNGSGKSTSVSALLRLITPDQGEVQVDAVAVGNYQLDSYRRNFGYVPQEIHLFGSTIRENVLYGRPDATQAEMDVAAEKALLDDVIERLPNGWDEVVGEGGTTLSGGEARRLMLARAALRDATILVFDEPLTGLDPDARETVGRAIRHIAAGRTALVISHGAVSELAPDLVIRMEDGRCVETSAKSARVDVTAAAPLLPTDSIAAELEKLMTEESALALFREAGLDVSSVERTFARIRQDADSREPKAALVAFDFRGRGQDGSDVVLPGYVRLSLNGETQDLMQRWSGNAAKETPFGAGVRLLPTERSLLFLFPNDDGLLGLDLMSNPLELRAALGDLEAVKFQGWRITADETSFERVRYRPERRFLARGHLGLEDALGNRSTRDVFIRYFPDDRGERIADFVRIVGSGDNFSFVPRPLGALLDGRLFVEEFIDGEEFLPAFRSGRLDPRLLASRLRRLHSTPPGLITLSNPPEHLLQGLGERLEKLFSEPALAALANEAADNLVKLVPEERPPVPIHGDLHPDQILVRSDGPWFVDFERAGMGDPYQDLGNLVAHLLRLAQWNKTLSADLIAFTKALVNAYSEGQEVRPPCDLAFFVGRSMLVRARGALRRQDDNYLVRARRDLELANIVMSRPS